MKTNARSMPRIILLSVTLTLILGIISGCNVIVPVTDPVEGEAEDTVAAPAAQPGTVTATARIVPAREATLAFTMSGQMVELLVEEGQTVQEGDVIARLDMTLLDAQVEQAEAAVAVAEANLEQALVGARDAQIAEAESSIQAANAAAAAAAAQRDIIQSSGPTPAEIARAEVALQQAYILMETERTHYDWVSSTESRPDFYTEQEREFLPTQEQLALDKYEVTRMQYGAAQAKLENIAHQEANPAQVRAASAEIWASSADAGSRQAQLDLLLSGPKPQDVAIAEAMVAQAEAELARAELERRRAELVAPFAGTVSQLYLQEAQYAASGTPILLLADLSGLRVQTTDLSELDVASLGVGDSTYVSFDALPNQEFAGTISRIASKAQEGQAVNYTVTVELDELPRAARWGMTAFVEIPNAR